MTKCRLDPTLYFIFDRIDPIGLSGTYVDDLMGENTKTFHTLCEKTREKFYMASEENLPTDFT